VRKRRRQHARARSPLTRPARFPAALATPCGRTRAPRSAAPPRCAPRSPRQSRPCRAPRASCGRAESEAGGAGGGRPLDAAVDHVGAEEVDHRQRRALLVVQHRVLPVQPCATPRVTRAPRAPGCPGSAALATTEFYGVANAEPLPPSCRAEGTRRGRPAYSKSGWKHATCCQQRE
jgi:hypothetical protein